MNAQVLDESVDISSGSLIEPVILPLGNFYENQEGPSEGSTRSRGLGRFAVLSDSLINRILLNLLQHDSTSTNAIFAARTLVQFSLASSVTLAFASDDDLWRAIAFALFPTTSLGSFKRSWRQTVLDFLYSEPEHNMRKDLKIDIRRRPRVYSDVLFHKQRCRNATIDPSWIRHNDITRTSLRTLSCESFFAKYDHPSQPVILTDGMSDWSAASWDPAQLSEDYPSQQFSAGGYKFTFHDYFRYAKAVYEADDQPVYLFDPTFAEKAPQLAKDYDVPHVFQDDLFSVLGSRRPHYRWLIAGPPRSGSSFHKDPNATSAWNAAICGRKKWIFFPPQSTPPGIMPSSDGSHVTAPVSVIEWFTNFYNRETILEGGGLEATVHPGEIVYVPSGWWHCVLNLDMSIAITQNFVSEANVVDVAYLFKTTPDQISGCDSDQQIKYISNNFAALAAECRPHLRRCLSFALTLDRNSRHKRENMSGNSDVPAPKRRRGPGLWQALRAVSAETSATGSTDRLDAKPFSFGFG